MYSGYSQNFWVNLLGFNIIWYLCIFVGNAAVPVVTLLLVMHIALHGQPLIEAQVVILTGILGYAVDCALTLVGFFIFEEVQGITPLWLLFLWLGFSATLRQSLAFFSNNMLYAALFGFLGGSSSYLAAAHFGAVELTLPLVISGLGIGLIWWVLFPVLLWMSRSIESRLCR